MDELKVKAASLPGPAPPTRRHRINRVESKARVALVQRRSRPVPIDTHPCVSTEVAPPGDEALDGGRPGGERRLARPSDVATRAPRRVRIAHLLGVNQGHSGSQRV